MGGDQPQKHDVVLVGGRVIDPESGLDAIRHVGITGGAITAVAESVPIARRTVEVSGLVVAPGFIDVHSHALTTTSMRLQAFDGVTTALELEGGAISVERAYSDAAAAGRPINYGYSASWASARMQVMTGLDPARADGGITAHTRGGGSWGRPAQHDEIRLLLALLERELELGALGVGVLLGYAPDSSHREFLQVVQLAARHGVPTFVHARHKNQIEPGTALQGVQEIVAAGLSSGGHLHLCHLNSTALREVDVVTELIASARGRGVSISTEAYPYGTSMTSIGAPFLEPDNLRRLGITPLDITHAATGERPADAARLRALREEDPGAKALIKYLDENRAEDHDVLLSALLFDETMFASDAMPLVGTARTDVWPPPADAITHPRSAGTFARALRILVREQGALKLGEAIRRCSLLPAQLLEPSAPGAARKGRIQVGADADIVVFDPDTVTDRATYIQPVAASEGFQHVLVNGTFILTDGDLVPEALPGQPLRGKRR